MDVTFSTPTDVGQTYEVWIKQQLREIASGIGITYEQLTGDLTGVNYSSIRAGLLEFRRRCQMLQQQTIAFQFCRPVANRWLDVVFVAGILNLPGYVRDKRTYRRIEWRPQGWTWVDPLKDIMAELLAVRSGFKSRSTVIAEQGYDREVVDQQIAEDNASADRLGLAFDSDPRRTEKSGALQSAQDGIVSETVKGE
jgi:lambda family phage portal protein